MSGRKQGRRASVRALASRRSLLDLSRDDAAPTGGEGMTQGREPQRGDVIDGCLYDGAAWFHRVTLDVPMARVLDLLGAGADVAMDPCGCGGFCGYEWVGGEGLARVRQAGGTRWRRLLRRTAVEEWQNDEGEVLLLLPDIDINNL
jgi:hypothetical protein